jgi:hypothetical protein
MNQAWFEWRRVVGTLLIELTWAVFPYGCYEKTELARFLERLQPFVKAELAALTEKRKSR